MKKVKGLKICTECGNKFAGHKDACPRCGSRYFEFDDDRVSKKPPRKEKWRDNY